MPNGKFDLTFVKQNKESIIQSSLVNAKRLLEEGEMLMKNGSYSRATHLFISGEEEVAKALIVQKLAITKSDLNIATNHRLKLNEFQELIFDLIKSSATQNQLKEIEDPKFENSRLEERDRWTGRLSEMLEDTMYVRLKPAKGYGIEPDNNYWRKRAWSFQIRLRGYLDLVPDLIKVIKDKAA